MLTSIYSRIANLAVGALMIVGALGNVIKNVSSITLRVVPLLILRIASLVCLHEFAAKSLEN